MDLAALVQALADQLGLGALAFDDRDTCSLVFEDRFTVTLELDEGAEQLHLYTGLGKAPEDPIDQLTCFAALLEANLFGQGSGGANLALEPESGELLISRGLSLKQLSPGDLQGVFLRFVHAADAWQERVSGRFWEQVEPTGPTPSPAGPGPGFVRV